MNIFTLTSCTQDMTPGPNFGSSINPDTIKVVVCFMGKNIFFFGCHFLYLQNIIFLFDMFDGELEVSLTLQIPLRVYN